MNHHQESLKRKGANLQVAFKKAKLDWAATFFGSQFKTEVFNGKYTFWVKT